MTRPCHHCTDLTTTESLDAFFRPNTSSLQPFFQLLSVLSCIVTPFLFVSILSYPPAVASSLLFSWLSCKRAPKSWSQARRSFWTTETQPAILPFEKRGKIASFQNEVCFNIQVAWQRKALSFTKAVLEKGRIWCHAGAPWVPAPWVPETQTLFFFYLFFWGSGTQGRVQARGLLGQPTYGEVPLENRKSYPVRESNSWGWYPVPE